MIESQVLDPRSGTYIGCLATAGAHKGLSDDQYDTAVLYLSLCNEYRKALHSSDAYYEAGLGFDDEEAYQRWAKTANDRYEKNYGSYQACQN